MDSKSLSEQEKDIKDLLRRAERTPVKTSALRRDTLKRLIDLAHSPHPSLKIAAATNLKLYIKDFPELEDDAINAVYDLCEDPVASVRIKGYAAIVDVSREQSKWVKRNVDVLVQLLQSDEPEEVTFVKRALTQHLDMDPVVTLGVLCDQIVPLDEPLDEEEKAIRDRLRSLVITFLAGEAKRPLVERHATVYGTPAEQIVVSGLLKAVTKLAFSDVDVIVKDIVVALPSFKPSSSRSKELLDVLLTQIRAILKSQVPTDGESVTLGRARYYLGLVSFVTLDKRLVHPSHLLRFYYASLASKSILSRFSEEDQGYIIDGVARTFAACEEAGARGPPTAPAADLGKTPGGGSDAAGDMALRNQFPDICAVLLQVVADMKFEEYRPWSACLVFVQAITRRKRDKRWEIPQHVTTALRRIESVSPSQEASAEAKAAQEHVHSVIRSLLDPVDSSGAPDAAPPTPSKRPSNSTEEQKGNVNTPIGVGAQTGDIHAHGKAGIGSTLSKGDQRRVMNVNKRKLDAPNGPSSPSTPSGSRAMATPATPRNDSGRPASLPPRPSPATVASSFSGAPSVPKVDRQREKQAPPHLKDDKGTRSSDGATAATAATSSTNETGGASGSVPTNDNAGPSGKRLKIGDHLRRSRGRGARSDTDSRSGPAQNIGNIGAGPPASGATGVDAKALQSKREDSNAVPSLLSRLAGNPTNGKTAPASSIDRDQTSRERERHGGGRDRRDRDSETDKGRSKLEATQPIVPSKRRAEASAHSQISQSAATFSSSRSNATRPPHFHSSAESPVGFSIRGAAKAASVGSSEGVAKGPGSLLERLQLQQSSDSGLEGGRRKKRSKHS